MQENYSFERVKRCVKVDRSIYAYCNTQFILNFWHNVFNRSFLLMSLLLLLSNQIISHHIMFLLFIICAVTMVALLVGHRTREFESCLGTIAQWPYGKLLTPVCICQQAV